MPSLALPLSDDSRHALTDIAARDDWVEARLMRNFMRNGRPVLLWVSLVIPVIGVVLYNDVDRTALLCWILAAVLGTLAHYRVANLYYRDYAGASGAQLRAFMSQYGLTLTASAVIWGSSMFLYFRKAPEYDQFICMIVLVGMAGFAVGAFSACLRCFIGYINGLGGAMLAAMAYSAVVETPFVGTFTSYGLVVLLLIYWAALRTAGKHFYRVQRGNLELQFVNAALIASLTESTRMALEAVESKNRFIASAAHDLRQPVHALGLYADWLRAEPELVAQITPKIVQATQAVNALFDSIFDLVKLDASVIEVNWQWVDLSVLVDELAVEYAPLARERGLVLRKRVVPARLLSDPVLLKRLCGNLLSNAIGNTTQGGVLLAVRQGQSGPRIEVWDTGVGIAPEHWQAIFQEFYRVSLHNGTEQGFGLGLAVVSRLCKALRHRLSMRSRPGRGTVFRLDSQALGEDAPA
jgi:signal transduction histidine kinase